MFESGAILSYLADKTRVLLPSDLRERTEVFEWVFWQVGGLGPMAGQNHHFGQYAPEKIPYAIERYVKETNRLYGVLDRRLAGREFIAADAYTIADIAAYPRIVPWKRQQPTRSRTYAAGSMRCAAAVPRSAPMPGASHFRVGLQSPRRGRSCYLARRRRRCR